MSSSSLKRLLFVVKPYSVIGAFSGYLPFSLTTNSIRLLRLNAVYIIIYTTVVLANSFTVLNSIHNYLLANLKRIIISHILISLPVMIYYTLMSSQTIVNYRKMRRTLMNFSRFDDIVW
jgi:cadmium resistance protein CadD (predicted permease)